MGGTSSREEDSNREPRSFRSSLSARNQYEYPPQAPAQSSYSGEYQSYPGVPSYSPAPPQQPYYAPEQARQPPHEYGGHPPGDRKKALDRRYSRIADNYNSLEQVTEALARAGLESSNLIVGIDFTKSNEWTGARSYNHRSLHHIGESLNPYEQAITIIGKTLAAFDEDNLIPCYGFGDASTHDQDVFSFYPDDRFCNGFEEVLSQYREIVPRLRLAGPTSFAPIVEMAMTIVEQSGGQYHVLVIIADGQVTRSVDTERGQLSPQEQKTVDAIVEASKLPLSIVLVGVGDGPWDMMKEFDDNIPSRAFDNFQFVNFTEIMSKNVNHARKETEFALSALMEIPSQYKATIELNILGNRKGNSPRRVPLPPPVSGTSSFSNSKSSISSSFNKQSSTSFSKQSSTSFNKQTPPAYYEQNRPYYEQSKPYYEQSQPYYEQPAVVSAPPAPSAPTSVYDNQVCPICLSNPKDMAFGCGHLTCRECGEDLDLCPICRRKIDTRIKLY